MTGPLRRLLARLRRDEGGSVVVEAMIVLPFILWAYVGTFVFFDGFRAQSVNIKAAYVISDALSREAEVNDAYVDGMFALHGLMTATRQPRQLRVTAFRYAPNSTTTYEVVWSRARGGATQLSSAALNAMRPNLPLLGPNEWNVMVETWTGYKPPASVGIDPFTFEERAFTRVRFTPNGRLCWNGGTPATLVC